MVEGWNQQIRLRSRPEGTPSPDNFQMVTVEIPSPAEGEILCRSLYLSLDPYMRGRMSAKKSYAPSLDIGQVMVGSTVSEVVASRNPGFREGDIVLNHNGWQQYAVSRGHGVRRLNPEQAPITTALGVLGMPGLTAYVGLRDIGRPQPGETVVVSAAAGAVGSVAGQIAKIDGCRVVGIAGTDEKCRYVVEDLGFDACVNYRKDNLRDALEQACPHGVDIYFENVGGDVLEAVLRLLNNGARIPLCGLVSQYNSTDRVPGPDLSTILVHRALIQGFIVSDHLDRFPAFHEEASRWLHAGRLKYREDIVVGLDNAPQAFVGLFTGKNVGKLLVKFDENFVQT